MPTRFWEMAAGCLNFIGFQKRASIEKLLEKVPPFLVVALIVVVMYLPMSLAAASTVAVVALSSILIASLKKQTAAFKVFTNPKVVYVGLISYSLYLWHWGVLSISRWTIGIHWWSVPFQVAVMLCMAVTSYRWIETPLRKGNWHGKRWKTLVLGGGVLVTLSGGLVVLGKQLKGSFYLGDKSDESKFMRLTGDNCPVGREFKLEMVEDCILKSNNGRRLLVIGDSQSRHLRPLLEMLNEVDGFDILFYKSSGTNFPSLTETRRTNNKSPDDFRKHYKKTLDHFDYYFAQLEKGDIMILSSRYELRWGKRPIPQQQRDMSFHTTMQITKS
ncbi:acyltransferase family protein [Synechococcus sp. RS9902]|uniref:acyltransferase family protein n=1 Tax=Synechococcus sp. RS9902 TaxID=221345 RepID=UPI0018611242|nr:acyltransferase family protein [Synechococcus sp. RS9902]QNI97113.1 putative membrane protein [Synechococcus sp. RS9902]